MHHDRCGCVVSSGVPVSYRPRRAQANANNKGVSSKQRSKASPGTAHAKKDMHVEDTRLAYCTGGLSRLVVDLAARGIRAEQWVVHAAVCVSCLGVRWLGQMVATPGRVEEMAEGRGAAEQVRVLKVFKLSGHEVDSAADGFRPTAYVWPCGASDFVHRRQRCCRRIALRGMGKGACMVKGWIGRHRRSWIVFCCRSSLMAV